MTAPFNLDKALAGHTVYFRGKPVDEWHYFASAKIIVITQDAGMHPFNSEGISTCSAGSLELGPRVAWATYDRMTNRLDTVALFPSREEALHYCDSTITPVQVLIEV